MLAERKTKRGNGNLRVKHCCSLRSSLLVCVLLNTPHALECVEFAAKRKLCIWAFCSYVCELNTATSDWRLQATQLMQLCYILQTLACFIFELYDLLLTHRVQQGKKVVKKKCYYSGTWRWILWLKYVINNQRYICTIYEYLTDMFILCSVWGLVSPLSHLFLSRM